MSEVKELEGLICLQRELSISRLITDKSYYPELEFPIVFSTECWTELIIVERMFALSTD